MQNETPVLYKFQEKAIDDLSNGKHFAILGCGCGKTAIALNWMSFVVKETNIKRVCVWTTASKAHSTDWDDERKIFVPKCRLDKFEVISWNKAAAWVSEHSKELDSWVFIFDEIQRGKAGVSSGMGKAFLKVANKTENWIGITATPGDNWLHFYPYFQACGLIPNKTTFLKTFAITQTFKGFPEIVGWMSEDVLKKWWDEISTVPDTSQMYKELPPEIHKVVEFHKPKGYDKLRKTRINDKGEFLETTMGLCHALREMSFTKEKQQWIHDFIEGLGTNAVLFYNYIEEGDELEQIIKRARKEAKVWRIDGKSHDIPTESTIGKYDIVLCQWQSGSEALNLQFLQYWVSVTPTYSYMTSVQARGRIKRIGQKHNCMFFYYLKCDGIESDVYKALKDKKDFVEDVYINEEDK